MNDIIFTLNKKKRQDASYPTEYDKNIKHTVVKKQYK